MAKQIFTLFFAVFAAFSLTACGGAQTKTDAAVTAGGPAAQKLPESAVCPVAKETFKPTAKTVSTTYKGKTYYFCCPGCDKKFAANPDKYLAAGPATAAAPGTKKPCKGDCTKDCGDCANPNKVAAKKDCGDCDKSKDCGDCANPNKTASANNGVQLMTGADMGDALPAKATCTVSGREFKPTAETKVAKYDGKTHYFCCGGCAKKFAAAPAKFASK